MATRAMRICWQRGCNQSHANANGYCDTHAERPHGWKGGNTTDRGYGWKWQKLRNRIMHRDAFLCQPCKRRGHLTTAKEVDHIINKAQGGSDDPGNLEAICKPCHKVKTLEERKRPRQSRYSRPD